MVVESVGSHVMGWRGSHGARRGEELPVGRSGGWNGAVVDGGLSI